MEIKVFVVSVNEAMLSVGGIPFHQTLISFTGLRDWWNFIPGLYVIRADTTPGNLSAQIRKVYPNLHFIIFEMSKASYEGGLPQEAWASLVEKLKSHDRRPENS